MPTSTVQPTGSGRPSASTLHHTQTQRKGTGSNHETLPEAWAIWCARKGVLILIGPMRVAKWPHALCTYPIYSCLPPKYCLVYDSMSMYACMYIRQMLNIPCLGITIKGAYLASRMSGCSALSSTLPSSARPQTHKGPTAVSIFRVLGSRAPWIRVRVGLFIGVGTG